MEETPTAKTNSDINPKDESNLMKRRFKMTLNSTKSCYVQDLIGGGPNYLALKTEKTFIMVTSEKGLIVIKDNIEIYRCAANFLTLKQSDLASMSITWTVSSFFTVIRFSERISTTRSPIYSWTWCLTLSCLSLD